jgi:hypothetical protein
MNANAPKSLPSASELLLETSLYVSFPVSENDKEAMEALRSGKLQFDAYCVRCEQSSIFKSYRSPNSGGGAGLNYSTPKPDWMLKPGAFSIVVVCQRCSKHYSYDLRLDENGLMKTGQYPSMEDILASDLHPYRKLLRPADFAELRRAGGLYSHGIGIGSFVYLRRIFERLIGLHYDELKNAGKAIEGFWEKRMDEKIQALSSVLPSALVKYRKTYAILSKGLHELDEDTCRRYYPVVRAAIMRILEQDLQARKEKEAEAELERQVSDILTQVKGTS